MEQVQEVNTCQKGAKGTNTATSDNDTRATTIKRRKLLPSGYRRYISNFEQKMKVGTLTLRPRLYLHTKMAETGNSGSVIDPLCTSELSLVERVSFLVKVVGRSGARSSGETQSPVLLEKDARLQQY
jgi:hypothetical protein